MSGESLFVGGIFLLFGLFSVVGGLQKIRQGVIIKRNDPVPIRKAAQDTGVDEFEGVVEMPDGYNSFQAPFSGADAVAATYKVERKERRKRSNGRGSKTTWKTDARGEITQPFVVRDDSGSVEVDPTGADISPTNTKRRHKTGGSLSDDIRLRLSVLTDRLDVGDVLAQNKSKTRRYSEGYLAPGDEVHIYGTRLAERTPHNHAVDARVENAEEGLYKISAGTEAQTVKRAITYGAGVVMLGMVFSAIGVGSIVGVL